MEKENKLKNFLENLNKNAEYIRCFIRKWWRPTTTVIMPLTLFVNGVYLPVVTKTPAELTGLSLLVGAIVGAFAVREWGKAKGNE